MTPLEALVMPSIKMLGIFHKFWEGGKKNSQQLRCDIIIKIKLSGDLGKGKKFNTNIPIFYVPLPL